MVTEDLGVKVTQGLGVGEYCRPSASLVVRWGEIRSKGHLIQRKESLVILAIREGSLGHFCQ